MFLFRSLHRQYPVLLYVIDLNPESVDHPKLQCFIHIFHWYAVLTAANIDVAVGTDDALLEPFGPVVCFGEWEKRSFLLNQIVLVRAPLCSPVDFIAPCVPKLL